MSTTVTSPVLRDDNPYYNGTVFVFPDGSLALDRTPVVYERSDKDRYYTTGQGEELDPIAYEGYGNSKLWHIIADVNGIFFPFEIDPGQTLIIPDYDKLQITNL